MVLFSAPVASGKLGYGYTGTHLAQDYEVPENTPVYAAGSGTVESVGDDGALGNTIKIKHAGGYETLYGNLTTYLATVGETVTQGQEIGTSGGGLEEPDPGDSSGPHLPYQVWFNGKAINPVTVTANPGGAPTASLASFNPLDPLGLLSGETGQLSSIFGNIINPGFWLRGAFIFTGAILVLIVVVALFARTNAGQASISAGKSAVKSAVETAAVIPK